MENQPKALNFERVLHSPGVYNLSLLATNETRLELLAPHAYQNFSNQVDLNDNSDDLAGSVAQELVFRVRPISRPAR